MKTLTVQLTDKDMYIASDSGLKCRYPAGTLRDIAKRFREYLRLNVSTEQKMEEGQQTDSMDTLEDILQSLGCRKPFLKRMHVDADGHRQPFTIEGGEAYGKLISILYAVGRLTETDMEDAVETLDSIASSEDY